MRVYLAVAVLLLAFVAYTEAQEEETVQQKFAKVGTQITEFTQQVRDRGIAALETIKNSETTQKIKTAADEYFEWFKNSVLRSGN